MKKILTKFIEAINKNESSGINLLILSFIALIIKQYCNYITYKNLNYGADFYINSFFTDTIVILIVLGITILNQYIKNRIIKIFNNVICLVIFTIFCIDIFTIYFLQSRVSIFQAFQYVNNGSNGFSTPVIFILLTIISLRIISLILTRNFQSNSKITRYILISTFLVLGGFTLNFSKPNEINNVITLNISFLKDILIQDNVYALDEIETNIQEEVIDEKIKTNYEDYIEYVQGDGKDLNIILVFAESLSAIDSANMGGYDNMPYFDKIQKEGITFTNFIANGSTSDTAHISTLYGVIPLVNIGIEIPYTGYKLIMAPLPEFLNSQGYKTTFISTADLSFLNQREFLLGAGFQKIIGEENFKKNKKYTFDAAPDKDLYDRVIEEVQTQTGKYFIGLQTISYHKPYNTPKGKTAQTALQYSDEELYRFYKKLEVSGFFKSGILIIVGDHRKMESAQDNEKNMLGPNWYVRPVATVIGTGIAPGTLNNEIIQHTDFYNSIKKLVGNGLVQIDSTYNNIFSKETNRERGITNSRFFDIKYTVTYKNNTLYRFNNISMLLQNEPDDFQKYMKSYLKYELGINDNENYTNEIKNNQTNSIKLIGHQGSPNITPENSIAGFFKTKELGGDGVEFDVSYTKDHKNIVAHGEYLYASNCYNKKIGNYTYDWIKENCTLKNGETYKTLEEMLEMIDGLFDYYFLEIKVYDESQGKEQTEKAIETVKKLNMQDRVIFISYSNIAKKVLNEDPDIIFGRDTFDINDLDVVGESNCKYFLAPYSILTSEFINKAKNLGKEVVTYTINDTANYEKMVDYGVRIILTDEIKKLKEFKN